ncbi:MmpS family transport accessory protein [Mycobacterium sp. NPDC006124]|uniref:MmpS family transport accessory protein n=1 Tax=Mycobacterium sp. NPDC006124 TaxID=3156729 RepID=UPI0033BEE16D
MTSVATAVKRFWVILIVVVALLVAAVVVTRLRGFFGSDLPVSPSAAGAEAIVAFNRKTVTYEVIGPRGASGSVSYLDVDGQTREANFRALPWSVSVTTTDPGVFANLVAQADVPTLGCRILVNGTVTTERQATGRDAQAFCLDKAA